MSRPERSLSPGQVDLWVAFPGKGEDPPLEDTACRFLDAGELARLKRIRSPEGRRL